MGEVYQRQIKTIPGNGTTALSITPSANKRVHRLQSQLGYAGGTNTLAALLAATTFTVKAGTKTLWEVTGTQLRDFVMLRGGTHDFNGTPNDGGGCQITLPFAPEWLQDGVSDALALNPRYLPGAITVEVASTIALTAVVKEYVSDDLNAPFSGFLTMEVIQATASGVDFNFDHQIEPRGYLFQASVYPDTGASREPTPVTLYLGDDDVLAHEKVTSAQNDEALERHGLTPALSGRSANIYDLVFVKADMLSRAVNLRKWGSAKLKVEAAAAMSGTSKCLLVRIEGI